MAIRPVPVVTLQALAVIHLAVPVDTLLQVILVDIRLIIAAHPLADIPLILTYIPLASIVF
jgi:hypothetical protein